MAAEWSAFIKLVSVRGRIFSVPLTLGMLPICWPQPQTCVQLSHFQASFHLINTHTYTHTHTHTCRAWPVWVADHKTRLKLKAHFSSLDQHVSLLIWLILFFPVIVIETCLQFSPRDDVFVYAPCHCSWRGKPVSRTQLRSHGSARSRKY